MNFRSFMLHCVESSLLKVDNARVIYVQGLILGSPPVMRVGLRKQTQALCDHDRFLDVLNETRHA